MIVLVSRVCHSHGRGMLQPRSLRFFPCSLVDVWKSLKAFFVENVCQNTTKVRPNHVPITPLQDAPAALTDRLSDSHWRLSGNCGYYPCLCTRGSRRQFQPCIFELCHRQAVYG